MSGVSCSSLSQVPLALLDRFDMRDNADARVARQNYRLLFAKLVLFVSAIFHAFAVLPPCLPVSRCCPGCFVAFVLPFVCLGCVDARVARQNYRLLFAKLVLFVGLSAAFCLAVFVCRPAWLSGALVDSSLGSFPLFHPFVCLGCVDARVARQNYRLLFAKLVLFVSSFVSLCFVVVATCRLLAGVRSWLFLSILARSFACLGCVDARRTTASCSPNWSSL